MGSVLSNRNDTFNSVLDYLPPGDSNAALSLRTRVHTNRDVAHDYVIHANNVIGHGLNGAVVTCTSRYCEREFALKTILKSASAVDSFRNEVLLFLEMDHPNIARLHDVYETKDQVSLVMEYCRGGELYDKLVVAKQFAEGSAQRATRQMLRAVSYVHHMNIVHRDLKMENFIFSDVSDCATLKLIDFGFSYRWANHAVKMKKGCGSLMYVAPEVIQKSYTSKCDMWSLGIIVYVLISGTTPFCGSTKKGLLHSICNAELVLTGGNWDYVSADAKSFVRSLLNRNPAMRPTAEHALALPWLAEHSVCRLGMDVLIGLNEFAEAEAFKRVALRMLAWIIRAPDRKKVEALFLALDEGKEGYIKLQEFQDALKNEFNIPETEATRLFEAISDGSRLYYTDLLAAMVNHRIDVSDEIAADAFNRFDCSNTGFISSSDLRNLLGETFEHENVDEMVASLTEDPRGLSYDLFVDVLKEKKCRGTRKTTRKDLSFLSHVPSSCAALSQLTTGIRYDYESTVETMSPRTAVDDVVSRTCDSDFIPTGSSCLGRCCASASTVTSRSFVDTPPEISDVHRSVTRNKLLTGYPL